jgi:signal transduction histidine kinase
MRIQGRVLANGGPAASALPDERQQRNHEQDAPEGEGVHDPRLPVGRLDERDQARDRQDQARDQDLERPHGALVKRFARSDLAGPSADQAAGTTLGTRDALGHGALGSAAGWAVNPLARLAAAASLDASDSFRNRDTAWLVRHRSSVRTVLTALLVVLAPAAATLVTLDLIPVLGGRTALPLVAAIVLVAWFGGPVAGVASTGLAIGLDAVILMAPYGEPSVAALPDRIHLAMLAGTALLVDGIAVLRARAEARARDSRRQAEDVLERANVAARRLEALQTLATDLADAATVDRIVDVLLARSSVALISDRCAMALLDDAAPGGAREVASLEGYAGDQAPMRAPAPEPVEAALVDVARTGQPLFDEGRAAWRVPAGRAVAAVPIQLPAGPGVLSFIWNEAHPLPPDRQAFVAALARAGSAALDRHRMFAAELSALRRAEAATGHLNILADAGEQLGTTLDYESLVACLPALGIPQLGDIGVLDLKVDHSVRRVATSREPDLEDVASVLQAHPLTIDRMDKGAEPLREGRAATFRLDDEVIARLDRSPEVDKALRRLAPAWLLLLPLVIQGATTGVLTFIRRADQPFDVSELAVGEELGRRVGRALENARLHRQVEGLAELERRRAAELMAVLGAVEEGFLLADSAGVIRASNSAAERLLGGPMATLDELYAGLIDGGGRTPAALSSQPEELRLRNRPNAWVEFASYPVASSSAIGSSSVVIACRDVTAFRRGQALREAFLGLLSHELRTPVTTIYAAAAVLTRRGRELEPAVADEVLADIAAEADRLYRLVEDLMVLARFDEGLDIGAQPVLLQHLIPAAVHQEASRWPGVSFDCVADPELETVAGDETAIAQVLRNLLSNAAKYSPLGGKVGVTLQKDPDGVAVVVRDEGPGIDPSEGERIFDPFYRSPSTAGLASGAGIGLYVSRRLVDAMGGQIAAGSAEGAGSEFRFVLPVYRTDGD